MFQLHCIPALGFSLAIASLSPAAISIQNFAALSNDRFANDPSFVGATYDWSGVGRAVDGKWAVMISPNVFLSATHHHAENGATLSFFPGNDGSAIPVTGIIGGSQQVGGTDLWLGYLSSPLPTSIASYDIVTVSLNEAIFSGSSLDNKFAYMSGISPTVGAYGASSLTNQAVGTNRIEGFIDSLSIAGTIGPALMLVQNLDVDVDAGFTMTGFETDLNDGDSGSPLMVISGGELVVAGIATASGTASFDPGTGTVTRNAAAYSYTGNNAAAIQSYIAAHPVPEPQAVMLVIAASGFLVRRRRPI